MNRRRFIVGLAGATTGIGAVLGSGAFSSAEAERVVSVEVTDDDDAYLGLRQLGSGHRSIGSGTPERVEFRFPGSGELLDDPDLGLGSDSIYEFVYDSEEPETSGVTGLLRIINQGTNAVEVFAHHAAGSGLEIELFDVEDPTRTALRDARPELEPGESVDAGVRIATFSVGSGTYDETVTIVAQTADTPDP